MHGQFAEAPEVVPFSRSRDGAVPEASDQLDKAGQTILQLVAQAAGIADENSRHALDMAQKLSDQLRAAEDRVAELEAELPPVGKDAIVPNNGSIVSTARSKSAFSNKATLGVR